MSVMLDVDLLELATQISQRHNLSRSDILNGAIRVGLPEYSERLRDLHEPIRREATP